MTSLQGLISRSTSGERSDEQIDIILGIPLESQGKTIYPVFRGSGPIGDTNATPHKIGYLEISGGRSDYTSLESDNRPLALVLVMFLVLALAWLMWRGVFQDRR
jgi:hypothetical protein